MSASTSSKYRSSLQALFLAATLTAITIPLIPLADDAAPVTIRRFALIAGANDGGPTRVRLRYANNDAQSMFKVLRNLGGVSQTDTIFLTDVNRTTLLEGFERMGKRLEQADAPNLRLELLFYFSGHSDEQGLMLGRAHLSYRDVRAAIDRLPADVKIAVVDSCASGALTRGKGGVRRPPFLVDSSGDVSGFAILTSASADEAAQESDRVGGSFFTHFLVSGLRGAADTTRDDKVTLNEAYAYAFHETLARTESTQAGPQHPNYDFQLAGSGDLVLTDLRGTSALIVMEPVIHGRLFIRDDKGTLVAEIAKPAGRPMSLGLEPGRYEVTLEQPAGVFRGNVQLNKNRETQLAMSSLTQVATEKTVRRGGRLEGDVTRIRHRPVSMGLFPGVSTDGGAEDPVLNNFSLNLIGWGDHLIGLEISSIGAIRRGDVKGAQISGIFNYTHGTAMGLAVGGITNIAKESQTGAQVAGIANVVAGAVNGLQVGGIANVASDDAHALQVGGIANVVKGSFTGLQVGGIANVDTGRVIGLQVGGIGNYDRGGFKGLQIGGIANISQGEVYGMQLGGIVNVGGRVTGAQIGLINIATEEMNGVQIGLVNWAKNGLFAPTYWASDTAVVNVGLKMGGRHAYGLLGYAGNTLSDKPWSGYLFGLGGHIELSPLWVEIDAVGYQLFADHSWNNGALDMLVKLRAMLGWRIFNQLSIYGGPTLNTLISEERKSVGVHWSLNTETDGDTTYNTSIGFLLGLQWEPQFGTQNSIGRTE